MAAGRHCKPTRRALARAGKHRRPSRVAPRAAVLVTVPAVLCGGTAAYAFWSASGSGSATVSTTSAAPLTVTAGAAAPALYPGRTVDLGITVANTNGYPVSLTKLTAVSVTSSDATACPAANISVASAVSTGIASGGYVLPSPIDVTAGSSSNATLGSLLTMEASAPDGCQGKTFTVDLSLAGSQV